MALLFAIPPLLQAAVSNGSAVLIGAIIKDVATGRILGHVQQTGVTDLLLSGFGAIAKSGFTPLSALQLIQGAYQTKQISQLQDSFLLMQGLQYGTLALSGLGLGVSLAGFALMDRRLRGMQEQLTRIEDAIGKVTADRREDEIGNIFSDINGSLRDVDSLPTRPDARLADDLQRALDSYAGRLEQHFIREARTGKRDELTMDHLERLWVLASAIGLCRDAAMQALFVGERLATIQANGRAILPSQMQLWESINPDALARLVARKDPARRDLALEQARLLSDGLRGGVAAMAGNISIARTLAANGSRGIDYVLEARGEKLQPLLFLPAA